jgi:fatty-acyl-CoA synthase
MREHTFGELVAARSEDDHVGLRFGDDSWTWRELVAEARRRCALVADLPAPRHVALAMANTPEHLFWWFAAALGGFTVVGVNPTRRGPELTRDLHHTDCRLVVADASRREVLVAADHGIRTLWVDDSEYDELCRAADSQSARPADAITPDPSEILSLVFTSGTTSDPKAVICTQARMGRIAQQQRDRRTLTRDDVFYVVMPMFHSNAVMAGIAPRWPRAARSCCGRSSPPPVSCPTSGATA